MRDARNVQKTCFPVQFDSTGGGYPLVTCIIMQDSKMRNGIDEKSCYLKMLMTFRGFGAERTELMSSQ